MFINSSRGYWVNKRTSIENLFKKEEILYKLARLVRNTDCIHPTTKGRMKGDLLCQLRQIDGEKYDKLVLGKEPNNVIIDRVTNKIKSVIGECDE